MLVIRKSDDRIFAFGPECSIDAKGIYSPGQFLPFNALASSGVAPVQADFEVVQTNLEPVGHYHQGFSHQWSGSAIESVAGYTPPTPATPDKWEGCIALQRGDFIGVVSTVLGSHYVTLRADAAFVPIWDIIMSSDKIDPHDREKDFKNLIARMKATDLASAPGTKMLTTTQEDAIIAAWKQRQAA